MLTFLRRIRKSLIDSGSTRKYLLYAIGEIALVVIGILIALQINNWNEFKRERANEKELLQDILSNIERNSVIMHEGLEQLNGFNKSSDIVLNVLSKKLPYNDSLGRHFFAAFRTAGLLFPISMEGYEAMKNAGFDIIRSKKVKDRILQLYEVCYQSIEKKADWSMVFSSNLTRWDLFKAKSGDEYIPINYDAVLNDEMYYSQLVEVKENYRNFLKDDVVLCLAQNEEVIEIIKDELDEADQ